MRILLLTWLVQLLSKVHPCGATLAVSGYNWKNTDADTFQQELIVVTTRGSNINAIAMDLGYYRIMYCLMNGCRMRAPWLTVAVSSGPFVEAVLNCQTYGLYGIDGMYNKCLICSRARWPSQSRALTNPESPSRTQSEICLGHSWISNNIQIIFRLDGRPRLWACDTMSSSWNRVLETGEIKMGWMRKSGCDTQISQYNTISRGRFQYWTRVQRLQDSQA